MINGADLSEVYHIHLFDYLPEDCFELILKYKEKAVILREWAKPFGKEKAGRPNVMYGNLYIKKYPGSGNGK